MTKVWIGAMLFRRYFPKLFTWVLRWVANCTILFPFGVGSYEFITFSPHLTMDFVSANKIHTCIGVSKPGINTRIRLHLTMKSIRKRKSQRKRFNGPQSGAGSRKMNWHWEGREEYITCFKTRHGEMQRLLGEESEVFVWLINHIYQQAASYIDTGVSEGDHSLSKLRSLLYHGQDGSENRELRVQLRKHSLHPSQPPAALMGMALIAPIISWD